MSITKNKKKKSAGTPALDKEVLKRVKGDTQIVAAIITATGKSYPTVQRWLDTNSEMLTTAKVLNVICQSLNLTWPDVLYKVPVKKTEDDAS